MNNDIPSGLTIKALFVILSVIVNLTIIKIFCVVFILISLYEYKKMSWVYWFVDIYLLYVIYNIVKMRW